MPSLKHYLIVDSVKQVLVHHRRGGKGVVTSMWREGVVTLDPPGIELDVAACFGTLRRAANER